MKIPAQKTPAEFPLRLGIIIVSDRAASGHRPDETIPLVEKWCRTRSVIPVFSRIVPDDAQAIRGALKGALEDRGTDLIVTSGGTGLSPRDITPEITGEYLEKRTPGIDEFLRAKGREVTPFSVLSRGISGIAGERLIINLPGNPAAVIENLDWLLPVIRHALRVIRGAARDTDHKAT